MKQLMALFMIFLFVTIPVSYSISIASVTFETNPPVKTNFGIHEQNITIRADFEGVTVEQAQSNARFGQSRRSFEECVSTQGLVRCSTQFEVPLAPQGQVGKVYEIPVFYGNLQKMGKFFIDDTPPTIESITHQMRGDTINITVRATDTIDLGFPQYCSGFHSITISLEGESQTIPRSSDDCDVTVSALLPLPRGVDGAASIQVTARDLFGNEAQRSQTIALDTQAAQLSNLQLRNAINPAVRYISSLGTSAFVSVSIDSVSDLLWINATVNGQSYDMTCSNLVCRTPSITFTEASPVSVQVQTSDQSGNIATLSQSFTLSIDSVSPVVRRISTPFESGDVIFVSPQSNITVHIDESGSGLYFEDITMTLLGRTYSPRNCTPGWQCTFSGLSGLVDGVHSVTFSGRDDVGNSIQSGQFSVQVDTIKPVIDSTSVRIFGIGPTGETDYFIAGSLARVTFNVTDASRVTAFANFSNYGAGSMTSVCSAEGVCSIQSPTAVTIGGVERVIPITVTDQAGNVNTYTLDGVLSLDIHEGESEAFLINSVAVQPTAFERSVATYINQHAFARVELEPKIGAQILDSRFISCKSNTDTVVLPGTTRQNIARIIDGLQDTGSESTGSSGSVSISPELCRILGGTDCDSGSTATQEDSNSRLEQRVRTSCNSLGYNCGDLTADQRERVINSVMRNLRETGTSFVGGVEFFGSIKEQNNGNPELMLIHFPLRAVDINELDGFSVTCQLAIEGRDTTFYIQEEIHSFNVTFETFGFEFGSLDDTYYRLYEDALDTIRNARVNKLASLKKLFDSAEKICRMLQTLMGVLTVIHQIGGAIGITAESLIAGFFTAPAGAVMEGKNVAQCQIWQTESMAAGHTIFKYIQVACDIVTCQFSLTSFAVDMYNSGGDFGKSMMEQKSGILGNVLGGVTGGTETAFGREFNTAERASVKDNLYLSYLNLCIPGIIHNLEKQRQIDCQYAVCLRDQVPQGVPISACQSLHDYATCVFVTGGILGAFGFIIDYWIQQIMAYLLNPIATAMLLAKIYLCQGMCTFSQMGFGCRLMVFLEGVANLINILQSLSSSDWGTYPRVDYCEMLGDEI